MSLAEQVERLELKVIELKKVERVRERQKLREEIREDCFLLESNRQDASQLEILPEKVFHHHPFQRGTYSKKEIRLYQIFARCSLLTLALEKYSLASEPLGEKINKCTINKSILVLVRLQKQIIIFKDFIGSHLS